MNHKFKNHIRPGDKIASPSKTVGVFLNMLAQRLYHKIPLRLRWIVSPFVLWFRLFRHLKSCFPSLRHLRLEVWNVAGEEQNSGMPLSILYAANNDSFIDYLANMIFGASFRKNHLGRVWLWNIRNMIASLEKDNDLIEQQPRVIPSRQILSRSSTVEQMGSSYAYGH